jgi:hypothetical protein
MPETVIAAATDTLCTIASRFGFLNCDPLRADPANAAFLNRPLRDGDVVTVPDIVLNILEKAVEQLHVFLRKGIPAPSIRFVHGSKDKPYKDDLTLTFLNVSNYISDKAGKDGKGNLPKGFGFNQLGDDDLDTFKVEVVEPNGGADLEIELEALKPVYAPDGTVLRHEPFTDAQAGLRKLKVKCEKVKSAKYKGYRSRYMRLVTDEEDLKAISGNPVRADGTAQGLFTSDMADGNAGAADKVEILDQLVQATYILKNCPAGGADKCKVQATLPIGPLKQRIKLCFHLFRSTVGGGGIGGVNEQNLRRRTFKWYRRVFAQAEFGPKLVAPTIQLIDPPAANMLVLSDFHGRSAVGSNGAGASTLSFDLEDAPGGGGPAAAPVNVSVNLGALVAANGGAPVTPDAVALAVVAALPAGFTGQAFENGVNHNQPGSAADILITKNDGKRILIRNERTDDLAAGMTVLVARVNLTAVNDAATPDIPNAEVRRIVRAAPGDDTRLDCYVFGQFAGGTRGLALTPDSDVPVRNQNKSPMRWANLMATTTMDGTDANPFTYPHESGHVLMDLFHTDFDGGNAAHASRVEGKELMRSGTSGANSVNGSKRICDSPLELRYAMFRPTAPGVASNATQTIPIFAVQRLRARGTNVFDTW